MSTGNQRLSTKFAAAYTLQKTPLFTVTIRSLQEPEMHKEKRTCKKIWTREEQLLVPLLEYFDKIRLSDAQIESVVASLKHSYAHEQEFFKHSQETLRKELDQIQSRLSKLIDMHLDGGIDSETYHLKLEKYKKRQREITSEMKAHINADETC